MRGWTVDLVLCGGFLAAYAWISLSRYDAFASKSWDLGIFVQVVRSYAEGRVPVSDLLGPGFVIFGDHFSPILAVLAPFYWLFPSAQTLLIAQAALFALSVLPVTRTATRLLGNAKGRAVGFAYGLSWGVQRAVDFDFHEICFAVPLVAFALQALLTRRWWRALAWCAPLVLVKEDLCLTAAVISAVLAWRARRDDRRCAQVAVGSVVLFVACWAVITLLIIPSFNPDGSYRFWSYLSGGTGLFGPLLDGWREKLSTTLWILLPTTGLIALRSPVALVLLPTLAWRFVSDHQNYWSTDWHYDAVLMPVVTLAMVEAIATVRAADPTWLRRYAARLPGVVLAAALALSITLPLGSLIKYGDKRYGVDSAAASRVLARIPDGAVVEGNIATVGHLAARCRVFWIGNANGFAPDYIAIRASEADMRDDVRSLHPETAYQILASDGEFWVLRRATAGAVQPGGGT